MPGIYTALTEAAETMRRGGGVGYDFSASGPPASGWPPRAAMPRARSAICGCLTAAARPSRAPAAGAARRWACCASTTPTSRFIHAKDEGDLRNFNISVGVTDAFMQAVVDDGGRPRPPRHAQPRADRGRRLPARRRAMGLPPRAGPQPVGPDHAVHLRPRRTWRALPRPHQRRQQPALLRDHLGHQPLRRAAAAPYGCCCLGSIDLTRFVREPFAHAAVRRSRLCRGRGRWPRACWTTCSTSRPGRCRPRRARRANKRRVGLGFTGLGDALVMLNLRYDTPEARAMAAASAR